MLHLVSPEGSHIVCAGGALLPKCKLVFVELFFSEAQNLCHIGQVDLQQYLVALSCHLSSLGTTFNFVIDLL